MTKSDFFIVGITVLFSLGIYVKGALINNKSRILAIKQNGVEIYESNLPVKKIIQIKTVSGSLLLEIEDYRARVIKSDCPKKFCKNRGWIENASQMIICIPFKLSMELKNANKDSQVDAITK
jgi:hypothetical protein